MFRPILVIAAAIGTVAGCTIGTAINVDTLASFAISIVGHILPPHVLFLRPSLGVTLS